MNLERTLVGLSFPVIYLISLLFPKSQRIWLFSAWYGRLYEDNPRVLFEKCHKLQLEGVCAYWLYKGPRPVQGAIPSEYFVPCYSTKGIILQLRAKVFVLCVNSLDFCPCFVTIRSVVLQTWHGTPMKKIGYSLLRNSVIDKSKFWIRRLLTDNYTFVISPNEYTDRIFCEAFQVPKVRLIRAQYPRCNDLFLKSDERKRIRQKVFHTTNERVWLYLPTHRNEGRDATQTRRGYESLLATDRRFKEFNIQVVFKPHYYEERYFTDIEEGDCVYKLRSGHSYSLYQILGAADGLITDYSSVAYDFEVISDNVIIYNFDDFEFRKTNRELTRLPSDDFRHRAGNASEIADLITHLSMRKNSMRNKSLDTDLWTVISSIHTASQT